jgi:hypothetical protein
MSQRTALGLRRDYQDKSKSLVIATGDTPTTVGQDFIVGRAKYTIFCQKLTVNVFTAAAQALTFQDDATTPVILAVLAASAPVTDLHILIDNEEGIPLTEGKNLDITGAAGVGCRVSFTGYLKPTGTMTQAQV